MTQITLKNGLDYSRMSILLGLLNSWNVEAEVKEENAGKQPVFDAFEETRGMWAGRDIDGKRLRAAAWGLDQFEK